MIVLSVSAYALRVYSQARLDSPRQFEVTHYDVLLEPHIDTKEVSGTVMLTVTALDPRADTLVLNRGNLEVESVEEGGAPLRFTQEPSLVRITVSPGRTRDPRSIAITYRGTPRSGLVILPERQQMYTIFSTSQWMIAVDAPDARATMNLNLAVPRGWAVVASGREIGRRSVTQSTDLSEWRIDRPVPTYTFGFVAGQFSSATDMSRGPALHYLANGFSGDELRRVFGETRRMIAFFERRAGMPYPGDRYSQALVAKTAGQEMAGFSVLPEDYGRAALADSTVDSLIAHELAHQWWGNMVTCREWTEFWLNEGFATFMAAAYREERYGLEVYRKDVESMKTRYEQVRSRGHDRSLVFPDWTRPTADDRTLVYQKGAYVLHQLRQSLGDQAFWEGLRRYTTEHFGTSVTTKDFQAAMERTSGKDLSAFFGEWIWRK